MSCNTFSYANQIRLALKMKLSQYAWYCSSRIISSMSEGYEVVITTKIIDNEVRKIIPPLINGISIKTELSD